VQAATGKRPEELRMKAGMKLINEPVKPRFNGLFFIPAHQTAIRNEWKKYLHQ
jgi:hypothetical protein